MDAIIYRPAALAGLTAMPAAAMTALGLVLTLPGALYERPDWAALEEAALPLGAVLFYALVPAVCGFWLWYAGAARLPFTPRWRPWQRCCYRRAF